METKWLVELRLAYTGHEPAQAQYYAGYNRDGKPVTTDDPWKAAAFFDRYSATCASVTLCAVRCCVWRAVEHGFTRDTHRVSRVN